MITRPIFIGALLLGSIPGLDGVSEATELRRTAIGSADAPSLEILQTITGINTRMKATQHACVVDSETRKSGKRFCGTVLLAAGLGVIKNEALVLDRDAHSAARLHALDP